jgi:phosphoribosylanthranilate isomerase
MRRLARERAVQFLFQHDLNAPENLAEALAVTGASMVDVSSGVERAPGEKDPDLVRRFIQAAKAPSPLKKAVGS